MTFDHIDDKLGFVDLDGYLEMLSSDLTDALRPAKGDTTKQKIALCRYCKSGIKAGIPREHLISHLGDGDFFTFDGAEYTDEEREAVMVVSDGLTDDEINKVEL